MARWRRVAGGSQQLHHAVVLKDTHFNIVDDWASFEASPKYDHANVVSIGLYTSDYLSDG